MGVGSEAVHLAARQGGYVSRSQLTGLGLTERAIDWRINSGELIVVSSGVYRLFPSDDHEDLIRGALLALPEAVASHESAAHLLELPTLPRLRPTVTVASHTTHRFPGVVVRRGDDLDRTHLTRIHDIRVTNVARTLFDLAGLLRWSEFDALAEASLLAGRFKEKHLERMLTELGRRGKRGTRNVRDFLAIRSGAPGATVLERKGRAVIARAGLPAPLAQLPIPWSERRRFDDAYPQSHIAIEWDSRAWHEQRAAMESDRRRDREAAVHGWKVVRFTWRDVTENPAEIVSTLSTLLGRPPLQ